jgi:hypothetical protein
MPRHFLNLGVPHELLDTFHFSYLISSLLHDFSAEPFCRDSIIEFLFLRRYSQNRLMSSIRSSLKNATKPAAKLLSGTPFLEGPTVTVAGVTLLQRVASAVGNVGGTIQSSQVDVLGTQARDGLVGLVVSCEMEQSALQKLLYDLEAGMHRSSWPAQGVEQRHKGRLDRGCRHQAQVLAQLVRQAGISLHGFRMEYLFAGTMNQADVSFHDHIFCVGLNYEFNPAPVVAK